MPIILPTRVSLLAAENVGVPQCVPGGVYTELSPVTGNTMQIYQPGNTYPQLKAAKLRLCATVPNANSLIVRLSTADDGPSNINPIAYIGGGNYQWLNLGASNVTNEVVDFTAAMNAALASKTAAEWQLYWQFSGNNSDTVIFYTVRLDLDWILPGT